MSRIEEFALQVEPLERNTQGNAAQAFAKILSLIPLSSTELPCVSLRNVFFFSIIKWCVYQFNLFRKVNANLFR